MREEFEKIYANNAWKHGSGEGSLTKHTAGYVALLQRFLRERQIKTVVDMGCGDWQFSRLVDWRGISYKGFDVVKAVIDENQIKYSSSNVEFYLYSGDAKDLPNADLLIAKDVMQHWSNEAIEVFLPNLERYRYSLITNCVNPRGAKENPDIQTGGFRPLDLRLPPFSMNAQELFSFTNQRSKVFSLIAKPRWLKKVLLFPPRA